MALSKKKTCLAVLHGLTCLNAESFAGLAGRRLDWMKKAAAGRIPLMPEVAATLAEETGCSLDWLLAGDVSKTPITKNSEPYSLVFFNWFRSRREAGKNPNTAGFAVAPFAMRINGIGSSAGDAGRASLFAWKLARALDGLEKEFGIDAAAVRLAEKVFCGAKFERVPVVSALWFHDAALSLAGMTPAIVISQPVKKKKTTRRVESQKNVLRPRR